MATTLYGNRILISLALLMMAASPTAAQGLAAGQRLRVTAPQLALQRQVGQLQWLDGDTLILATDVQRWVVPRGLLTQLESSRGRRGHPMLGLAVGAAVGFGVGAILFPPSSTACTGSGNYAENCRLYRAGIVLGGLGLGALAGALFRTERWVSLPVESVPFSPAPHRSPP